MSPHPVFPCRGEEGPVSKWVVTHGSWFLSQTPSGSQTLNKNGVGSAAQAVAMFQNPTEKALLTWRIEQNWLNQDNPVWWRKPVLAREVEATSFLFAFKDQVAALSWEGGSPESQLIFDL